MTQILCFSMKPKLIVKSSDTATLDSSFIIMDLLMSHLLITFASPFSLIHPPDWLLTGNAFGIQPQSLTRSMSTRLCHFRKLYLFWELSHLDLRIRPI